MENAFFYNYKDIFFIFPELMSTNNTQKKICIFKDKNAAKDLQKMRAACNATAIMSSDTETIEFWISKKIDFIVNPFDEKERGFDSNTFSILVQNEIYPIILLEKIITLDREKQIRLFKHLFVLIRLCKKHHLPIIILSKDIHVSYAFYHILGYNETQAQRFLKMFEERVL